MRDKVSFQRFVVLACRSVDNTTVLPVSVQYDASPDASPEPSQSDIMTATVVSRKEDVDVALALLLLAALALSSSSRHEGPSHYCTTTTNTWRERDPTVLTHACNANHITLSSTLCN